MEKEKWLKMAAGIAKSTWHPGIVVGKHQGSRFWDIEGKEYIDFASGPGVANVGWNHPKLKRALAEFILQDQAGHGGNEILNIWQIMLAEKIASLLPLKPEQWKVFFSNSGGEAIEAGTILAFLRRPERKAVLSFIGDFHGRMGFSRASTTSKPEHFLRLPQGPERAYYIIFPGDNLETGKVSWSVNGYIDYVKRQIGRFIEDINLAIFELIQGEGGVNVAQKDIIFALIEYLKKNDVLVMVDEVQTGFARTGKFFSFEHYGIEPDIVAMAKAASGGFVPIGITAFRKELDFRTPREHSNTHGGNPLACFTTLKVIEIIEQEGLIQRANEMGKILNWKLTWALSFEPRWRKTMEHLRLVPGGIGLMQRLTVLTTKNHPWPKMRDAIIESAIEEGLWLMGAGESTIRLLPALNITEEELDEGIRRFMRAVEKAVQKIKY